MKDFLKFLVFLFLILLLACNSRNDEHLYILQQAESIYQHPDGERFETTDADTLQLLPQLENASAFFISKNDYNKAAQASLYTGYAQKESNDKIAAMKSFKDAEHYGLLISDSLTIARAQYNIARLLNDDGAYMESQEIANLSIEYYGNHYEESAFVLNLMVLPNIINKDYENAELCLNKALDFAIKGNSNRAKRKIMNNYSIMYRERGDYETATDYIRQNIAEANDNDLVLAYLNIGKIYIYNDQYDSAAIYTNKALELSRTVKTRPESEVSIYFSLYYISKKQEKYKEALEYHETYTVLQYNVLKRREQNNIYNIQRQYDYETLQNQMNKEIIHKQRIILTISFLLLLTSIIVTGLLAQQKKILKEDKQIREELNETKQELQKTVKPEIVTEELSRQLHLILTANHIAKTANDYKKEWSPLVYKINNGKESLFEATADAIERVYPKMYETIKDKHPELNETESKVMLLSCSDLSNAEIGEILGLTVHTINKSKSEIRKKICQS